MQEKEEEQKVQHTVESYLSTIQASIQNQQYKKNDEDK